jgi:hypothetical protein
MNQSLIKRIGCCGYRLSPTATADDVKHVVVLLQVLSVKSMYSVVMSENREQAESMNWKN